MGIALPAQYGVPQMPSVVGQEIQAWIALAQPACQQVDSQRKAVHFGEQRHQESSEGTERAPVTSAARFGEAEGKDDKHCRVDHYERPETIGGGVVVHRPSPCHESLCVSWP